MMFVHVTRTQKFIYIYIYIYTTLFQLICQIKDGADNSPMIKWDIVKKKHSVKEVIMIADNV